MKKIINLIFLVLVGACTTVSSSGGGVKPDIDVIKAVVSGKSDALFTKFEKILSSDPEKVLSANGVIPCDRHDGTIYSIKGGDSEDVIDCSWGIEIVSSAGGDDRIDVGWGDDIIAAGAGDDVIHGARGDELIYPGPGNDSIDESWGSALILLGANWGEDTLRLHCDEPVTLVFSKGIDQEDITWVEKGVMDYRGSSKLVVRGGLDCLSMVFSDVYIP